MAVPQTARTPERMTSTPIRLASASAPTSPLARIADWPLVDRPLAAVARLAVRYLPVREPISAAWLVVACAGGWGLWILFPWTTMTIPGYQWLGEAASEWVWGLLGVGIGSAGAYGLWSYPSVDPLALRRRHVAMTVVGCWHIFIGLSFFAARPSSTGAPIYLLLGAWSLWHAVWLRVEAGRRASGSG